MNFNLTRPCGQCPFRSDKSLGLRPGRMAQVMIDIFMLGRTFPCHKTREPNESCCAGALIILAKNGMIDAENKTIENQSVRLAAVLGLFDPTKLDMSSPVAESVGWTIDHAESRTSPDPADYDNAWEPVLRELYPLYADLDGRQAEEDIEDDAENEEE